MSTRPSPAARDAVILFVSAWAGWALDAFAAAVLPAEPLTVGWISIVLALAASFAAWTLMLSVPIAAGTWLRRRARSSQFARWLPAIGATVLVWVAVFSAAVNWLLHGRTGVFIGLDGWRFFAFNAGQVLLHIFQVEGWLLGLVVALAGFLSIVVPGLIGRMCRRLSGRRWFTSPSVVWALAGAVAILSASTSSFHAAGLMRIVASTRKAISHVSPMASLLLEGINRAGGADASEPALSAEDLAPLASAGFAIAPSRRIWSDDTTMDWARLEALLVPHMQRAGYSVQINPTTGRPVIINTPEPAPAGIPVAPPGGLHSTAQSAADLVLGPVAPLPNRRLPEAVAAALTQEKKRIRPMSDYLAAAGQPTVPPYNVLFVEIDSLRADRLASIGARRSVMPNLDALAAQGVVFAQAYTQSPHSNYADPCPLASQYPLRSRSSYLYPRSITYPRVLIYDILKARGYRTAMFSSQNEEWGGMLNFLDTGTLDTLVHSGNFTGRTYVPLDDVVFTWRWLEGRVRAGKIEDQDTARAALDWITQDPSQPFFCYLDFQGSHFPYLWPERQPAVFQPADLTALGVELGAAGVSFFGYPPKYLELMRNRYDTSLHYVDRLLGNIVTQLTVRGLLDRTIIVVTGDAGELFLEHGAVTHTGALWQEALRVPVVLRAPGLAPRRIDRPVQHVDLPPTILGLLGLPPHPAFQGRDVLIEPAGPPPPVYALAQLPWAHRTAVIWDDHKLVYDHRKQTYELYDLRTDPAESINRITEEPEIARRLHGWLRRWYLLQLGYYENADIHSRYYPPD